MTSSSALLLRPADWPTTTEGAPSPPERSRPPSVCFSLVNWPSTPSLREPRPSPSTPAASKLPGSLLYQPTLGPLRTTISSKREIFHDMLCLHWVYFTYFMTRVVLDFFLLYHARSSFQSDCGLPEGIFITLTSQTKRASLQGDIYPLREVPQGKDRLSTPKENLPKWTFPKRDFPMLHLSTPLGEFFQAKVIFSIPKDDFLTMVVVNFKYTS